MIAAKSNKRRKMNNMQTVDLPCELVLENILTRVEVHPLCICSCVCKQWYYSIHHDPHFASSYSLQSSKNPRLLFSFFNLREDAGPNFRSYFVTLIGDQKKDYVDTIRPRLCNIGDISSKTKKELIGYCNGWICVSDKRRSPRVIHIFNFSRNESLCIFRPIHKGVIICYGFGFDSLTKEYKVVLLLNTVNTHEQEYKCLVFTLGTNSWRETTNPPPSHQQISSKVPYSKSAVFCGGTLFWRTREPNEMLLSFDLHNETFQLIPIPPQCVFTTSEQQKSVHLLETKGSLCLAYLERILGDPNNNSTSRCCKVHLHMLKDKVKQLWIKETFLLPSSLSPTARTRFVGFSDRVLLSWYDGSCHQIYDLHTKHLKVVEPCLDNGKYILKRQGEDDPAGNDDDDDQMVYHLHSHVGNLTSLQTFVPDGARRIDYDAVRNMCTQKPTTRGGLLCVGRESKHYYTFN